MNTLRPVLTAALLLLLALGAVFTSPAQAGPPSAQAGVTGGINLLSVLPSLICVGDTVQMTGAAGVEFPDLPGDPPLAQLAYINIDISANLGKVSPTHIWRSGDFTYFDFTYTAKAAGRETVTALLNDGVAKGIDTFTVQEKCDYDAFLLSVIDFTADLGDEQFHSLTHVTGMGQMKRLRDGDPYLQGSGTWDLEENMLSKPAECVQYFVPPLITSGPFDLDGKIDAEAEILQAILQFLPGKPTYHGKSICVDADGNQGEGWSMGMGGDPELAAKIQTEYPAGGGSQQVEMTGKGLEMIEAQGGVFDYTTTLTVIPR